MQEIENLKSHCLSDNWADIGDYLVGDAGDVISKKRKPRVLKQWLTTTGYPCVSIMIDGRAKKRQVHSLVCESFLAGGGQTVNHKNGIKTDNRVSNLEWCSFAENNEHARHLRLNNAYCENHYKAKLTDNQVREIIQQKGKCTHQSLAEIYGVGRKCITKIMNGQRWARLDLAQGVSSD